MITIDPVTLDYIAPQDPQEVEDFNLNYGDDIAALLHPTNEEENELDRLWSAELMRGEL